MSSFIKSLVKKPLADRKALFIKARKEYYNNGNSSLTDAEFDALEDSIRAELPNWKFLKSTGIKIGSKSEVELDVPMASLDKIQAGNPDKLDRHVRSVGGFHVIGEKIDGSSIQSVYIKGHLKKLVTRGDGVVGKDISYFIPYVNLPEYVASFKKHERVILRMEAAIPIKIYEKRWAGEFDSARAMASSLLNRQDVHKALKDLQFIALRVLQPNNGLNFGLAWAAENGFRVPRHVLKSSDNINEDMLVKLMTKWKATAEFETDGLVIFSSKRGLPTTGDRPKYAKAFKLNDEANAPLTKIVRIQWQPSRHGVLVPKAIIAPIKFGNVTVKQAALHNAKWAMERGCGVGAEVRVLRSGDIIPKIVSVKKAKKFALPDAKEFGKYEWDSTETSLVLIDKKANREVLIRQFTSFFQKLGLDKMSSGIAEKLVDVGATKTYQLVKLTERDFAQLPGVKSSAKTYAAQMKRVRDGEFPVEKLMVASGCFDKGVGNTRLATLRDAEPKIWANIMEQSESDRFFSMVAATPGCGPAFAETLEKGFPSFKMWMRKSGAGIANPAPKKTVKLAGTAMKGQVVAWTGYRSKEEEAWVESQGGTVSSLSSKTTILFYNPDGKFMDKVEKARAKGIQTLVFAKFKKG